MSFDFAIIIKFKWFAQFLVTRREVARDRESANNNNRPVEIRILL